jgi:ribonuclease HI
MALKLTTLEMIDLHYPEKEWLRVDTDGSQVDETNTAGAEEHCKLFSQYATVGVNKSNFNGEIEDISLALQQLLYRLQAFEKVLILVDSQAAIQAVSFNNQPKSKKINDIKQTLKNLEAINKIIIFKLVPSHGGLE